MVSNSGKYFSFVLIFCLALGQYVKLGTTLYTAQQYRIGTTTEHCTTVHSAKNVPVRRSISIWRNATYFCEGHLEDPQLTVI